MTSMIDMSNNRANIAYVGARPWHGLGDKLEAGASIQEWTKAAGLDFQAKMTPIYFEMDGRMIQAKDQFVVVRDDTHAVLGTFSGRYKPVQPANILSFFNDFVLTDDRFSMETAGSLKGGAVIWALAKFAERRTILGEEHAPYVMLTTSFDGTRATTAQATMIRVVCNNTLTASIFDPRSATVRVRHSVEWSDKVAEGAHEQLQRVAESFDEYKKLAETLVGIRISRKKTEEFLKNLVLGAVKEEEAKARRTNQINALMDSLGVTLREGTEKNTAWAAFNAVTRYVDHDRSTRRTGDETEGSARMSSSFFGSGAILKQKAVSQLLELA